MRINRTAFALLLLFTIFVAVSPVYAQSTTSQPPAGPKFSQAIAYDVSPPLRDLKKAVRLSPRALSTEVVEVRPERGPVPLYKGRSGDGALQGSMSLRAQLLSIPGPLANFEGLSNQDNFNIFGFRINPPDPMGDVGPNHYVELINLVLGVYSKSGDLLVGPVAIGDIWSNFAVTDCTEPSGDPVVLYDQFVDRWILSQFTTSGNADPTKPFWNCVAISTTGDPTGTYYRYAFETAHFQYFPDYPKYGVWTDSYVITTREFGPTIEYGIGVYALEKNKMVNGLPARAVSFFLDGNDPRSFPSWEMACYLLT